MNRKLQSTLLIAALILIISITPSITDVLEAHEQDLPHKNLLYVWLLIVVLVALAFGEVALGLKKPK